jgi:hypothetical protein
MISHNKYLTNGVYITPQQIVLGDKIRISYDGLLAKSGAPEVFAHVGFGNKWNNSTDIKMLKTPSGFETTVPVTKSEPLYICFKDTANNWDNNSGMNYTFDIVD